MGHEFVRQDKMLSRLTEDNVRRLRSESEVMALLEPERTLESLPGLLPGKKEREHVISIMEQAMALEAITEAQKEQADIIIRTLRFGAPTAKGAPRKRKERS